MKIPAAKLDEIERLATARKARFVRMKAVIGEGRPLADAVDGTISLDVDDVILLVGVIRAAGAVAE
jgi:hypothetical protein